MNCETAAALLPELLDARTDAAAHAEVRQHLAHCPHCQREFSDLRQTLAALDANAPVPPPTLRRNFYVMLEEEKNSAASAAAAVSRRHRRAWNWFIAPALGTAALLVAFQLGARFGATPAAAPADDTTRRELAALRQQVGQMSQLVGYSLLQQQQGPANDRLREVLLAAQAEKPSAKVLDELVLALAFDPSANVRLRALEALYAHSDNAAVRAGVVAALPREQNPLVQLELIDFVATARERQAAPQLERMSREDSLDQSVRAAARRALAQL
jgi:hypothetical protein